MVDSQPSADPRIEVAVEDWRADVLKKRGAGSFITVAEEVNFRMSIRDNIAAPRETASVWSSFIFDASARVPPEQPIYEGLLAKGDLAVWLGREKHRKSNVLLQFGICSALGRSFLHFHFCPSKALKVVMLDYESKTNSLRRKYDAIVEAMGLDEADQQALRVNLRIIEMRKAFRAGRTFARFPVKGQGTDFEKADEEWRSFIQEMDADLYIVDPLRCMHAHGENDSTIEALLTRVHQVFGNSAVVISHHLRKRNRKKDDQPLLQNEMRVWADEGRGSGAITAHADVIICQERVVEDELERLYLGAYLRDGADIEPMALRESDVESFFWQVAPDLPANLALCLDALHGVAREFPNRTAAAGVLEQKMSFRRSTAFDRVREMLNRGLLKDEQGVLSIAKMPDNAGKPKQIKSI
jgi:hypothetical protein